MNNFFDGLDESQMDFISKECGIDKSIMMKYNREKLLDLYDMICDIEIEETMKTTDGNLSDRGLMAESIVTIIGENIR